jgi:hypothetical protein
MSNGIPQDLVIYIGPYQPQLLSAVGIIKPFGGFSELNTVVYDTKVWDANAHIQAVTERLPALPVAIPTADAPLSSVLKAGGAKELLPGAVEMLAMNLRVDQGPANATSIHAVLDNPEYTWQYRSATRSGKAIGTIVLSYQSKWMRRVIYDERSMTDLLFDKVLSSQKLVNGAISTDVGSPPAASGQLTLDKFKYVVLTLINEKKRISELKTKVEVQYVQGGTLKFKEIDLRAYFELHGEKVVKPAFSEFYRTRMEDFKVEDKVNEERLAQHLGLTLMEREVSTEQIRASYNLYRLRQLFGIPVSVDQEIVVRKSLYMLAKGKVPSVQEERLIEPVAKRGASV